MTTQEAKEYFGGAKRLAAFLDCWPSAIFNWGDVPPRGIQYELEVRTGGDLKADRQEEVAHGPA